LVKNQSPREPLRFHKILQRFLVAGDVHLCFSDGDSNYTVGLLEIKRANTTIHLSNFVISISGPQGNLSRHLVDFVHGSALLQLMVPFFGTPLLLPCQMKKEILYMFVVEDLPISTIGVLVSVLSMVAGGRGFEPH